MKVISPKTGRQILVGKATYNKLLKDGYFAPNREILSCIILYADKKEMTALCQVNQLANELCKFMDYIINDRKAVNVSKEGCIYKVYDHSKPMAVKVAATNHEKQFYDLLIFDGFVQLHDYFSLSSFPSVFDPCKSFLSVENGSISCFVFIMPWIEYDLSIILNQSTKNKCCLLYEIVYALKMAKSIGIEHNDLHFDNIRLQKAPPRTYDNIECTEYQPIIIDFGLATINPNMDKQNKLSLRNRDFISFNNLLNYLMLPDKMVKDLTIHVSNKKGILFNNLLLKILYNING